MEMYGSIPKFSKQTSKMNVDKAIYIFIKHFKEFVLLHELAHANVYQRNDATKSKLVNETNADILAISGIAICNNLSKSSIINIIDGLTIYRLSQGKSTDRLSNNGPTKPMDMLKDYLIDSTPNKPLQSLLLDSIIMSNTIKL